MGRDPSKLFPHDYLMRAVVLPFIPESVKPNHVTVLRMALTPVVVYLLATGNLLYGVPLFILTAFTDAVDGSLARVRKQITPWGILFDPIADKLLIGLVIIVLAFKFFHPVVVLAAVLFDLLPMASWLARAKRDRAIMMANGWGKTKMLLQFCSMTLLLLGIMFQISGLVTVAEIVLVVATMFGAVAAITYSL